MPRLRNNVNFVRKSANALTGYPNGFGRATPAGVNIFFGYEEDYRRSTSDLASGPYRHVNIYAYL